MIDDEDSDVSVTPRGSSEEDEEDEDDLPTQRSMKMKREAMKKQSENLTGNKGKPIPTKVSVSN